MVSEASAAQVAARSTVNAASVREAALTLFAQRGYHGTALSQVAGLLGISTPSLYNHMRAKQDLLREIVADTTEQVWADYESAIDDVDDVAERLRRAVRIYALRHGTHQREALIVNRDLDSVEEPAHSAVLDLRRRHERAIRSLIEEGVAAGAFRVQVPALASFGILEMCVSIARWFREDGPMSVESVAEQYSEYALSIVGFSGIRPG